MCPCTLLRVQISETWAMKKDHQCTHKLALFDKISELEVSSLPLRYMSAQTARNGLKSGPRYWAYKPSSVHLLLELTNVRLENSFFLFVSINGLWLRKKELFPRTP